MDNKVEKLLRMWTQHMIGRRPAGSQRIEELSISISILEETRTFEKCNNQEQN